MNKLLPVAMLLFSILTYSQVTNSETSMMNKTYSKEIALYRAKHFVVETVLGITEQPQRVEIEPLAAANSGELTTMLYKSDGKEGLVLGFFGDKMNDNGLVIQEYTFKNFEKVQAMEFLSKLDKAIEENTSYIKDNTDNNNVFFKFDDLQLLITRMAGETIIRVFWKGHDATWEKTAFGRSKRRFERKTK